METEELKKNNKTLVILLVIVSLVVVFLLGYYTYNEFFVNEKKDTKDNKVIEPYSKADEKVFDRIKTVVKEELFVLHGLSNIDELTPEIKAFLALNLYSKDVELSNYIEDKKPLNAVLLEDSYKNSSLSKFAFVNTNIPCLLSEKLDHYEWTYKKEDKTYEYTEIGHGGTGAGPIDSEIVEKKVEKGLYKISYIYLWTAFGDFEESLNVYHTYDDALVMRNPLVTIEEGFDEERLIDTYAYEPKVLEKMNTYNYTFELVNNELKLKDFTRS